MATYFQSPNEQREQTPRMYERESWQGSNPDPSSVIHPQMMVYMNNLSSANFSELPPPQQDILSSPQMNDVNDLSAWGNGRSEMPFMPLLESATSLLQGVQNLQGQGLSLSLSTQIPPTIQVPPIEYRNPNPSGFSSFRGNNNLLNPIRDDENRSNYGLTSVGRTVPNSKYLKAAQELLDEVVNVRNALKKPDRNKEVVKSSEEAKGESEASSKDILGNSANDLSAAEKQDLQNKLSKLLTMLDEVDKRYRQYYHQMQIIISSFDAISGPAAASPYTSLALQTISRHFRTLRDAITNQINLVQKSLGEKDSSENGKGVKISRLRFVDQHIKQHRALQQMGMMQQQWRPQRGLPERSVSILRAWLFEHFLHPYPKDSEKVMLARQTGLTRNQVSNWFINARVRLWKPMVEEMYKEEAGDAEMASTSSYETENKSSKEHNTKAFNDRDNHELQQNTNSSEESNKTQFLESKCGLVSPNNLGPHLDDVGLFQGYQLPGFGRIGSSNSVSLTLGLQHCEGGNLPISVDNQNFAIYNTESYTLGPQMENFEMDSENRQQRYGPSHLLRDFVA